MYQQQLQRHLVFLGKFPCDELWLEEQAEKKKNMKIESTLFSYKEGDRKRKQMV